MGAGEEWSGERTFFRRPEVPGFWPSKGVVSFFVTENTMAAACAPTRGRRCARERGGGDEEAKRWRWGRRWRWRDRECGREGVVVR
jgi:hypothetical protein